MQHASPFLLELSLLKSTGKKELYDNFSCLCPISHSFFKALQFQTKINVAHFISRKPSKVARCKHMYTQIYIYSIYKYKIKILKSSKNHSSKSYKSAALYLCIKLYKFFAPILIIKLKAIFEQNIREIAHIKLHRFTDTNLARAIIIHFTMRFWIENCL